MRKTQIWVSGNAGVNMFGFTFLVFTIFNEKYIHGDLFYRKARKYNNLKFVLNKVNIKPEWLLNKNNILYWKCMRANGFIKFLDDQSLSGSEVNFCVNSKWRNMSLNFLYFTFEI